MARLNDWELMQNRQDFLNAIIAQAVDDYVIYLVQEELYPPEDGQPPESIFKVGEKDILKFVQKKKFPVKLRKKIITDPMDYANHLIKQKRYTLTLKYRSVQREGYLSEEFLTDRDRLSRFTKLSPEAMDRIIKQKKDIVIEQIRKGEASPLPPFKCPKHHTFRRK